MLLGALLTTLAGCGAESGDERSLRAWLGNAWATSDTQLLSWFEDVLLSEPAWEWVAGEEDIGLALLAFDRQRWRGGKDAAPFVTLQVTPSSGWALRSCAMATQGPTEAPGASRATLGPTGSTPVASAPPSPPPIHPRLLDWVKRCGRGGVVPRRADVVAGLPAALVWIEDHEVLLVHERLAAALSAEVRTGLLPAGPTTSQRLPVPLDSVTACAEVVHAHCDACPDGEGPGCPALFAPGDGSVCPTEVHRFSPTPEEYVLDYCRWRITQERRDPWQLWCLANAARGTPSPCIAPDVEVTAFEHLVAYFPGRCHTECFSWPAEIGAVARGDFENLERCASELRTFCDQCTLLPETTCPPLFPGSSARRDCQDLRRAETNGQGFWLYCLAPLIQDAPCLRGGVVPCADTVLIDRIHQSYQGMIMAMQHFLDPRTRPYCAERAGVCSGAIVRRAPGDDDRPPTEPDTASPSFRPSEGKCPQ